MTAGGASGPRDGVTAEAAPAEPAPVGPASVESASAETAFAESAFAETTQPAVSVAPDGAVAPAGPPEPPRPASPHGSPAPAHRWGFGAFLLVEAIFLLSAVFLSAILQPPGSGTASDGVLLAGIIVPSVLAAGAAVLITVVRGNGPRLDLRLSWTRQDLRTGLKLGAAGLVLTVVAAAVWTRVVGEDNATSAVGSLVAGRPVAIPVAVVLFLYSWLLGPICEELIFRGLCWGALERLQWGRWAVFALTTAIFAASHLEPLRTSLLLVITIPIGLGRLLTGRLAASIVAHQINNFLPALAVLLMSFGVLGK